MYNKFLVSCLRRRNNEAMKTLERTSKMSPFNSTVELLSLLFHHVAFFLTLAFLPSQSDGVQSGVKKATYTSHYTSKGSWWVALGRV